jgi:hypothetical protein
MIWIMAIILIVSSFAAYFLWKIMSATENKFFPASSESTPLQEDEGGTVSTASSEKQDAGTIKPQEARLVNDINSMLEALRHEKNVLGRHFLYRDIIAHTFPKRHQDPRMREIFLTTAQAHIKEMPVIIAELLARFGSMPYFFTFSYYTIALTETMEFDQAIETCRLARDYGAKDGLGIGFERRIELITKRKNKMMASQAA